MSLSELMIDIPAEHERNVFGQFDAYAKKLERTFHVTLIAREGKVKILGEDKNAEKARRVLDQLAALSKRGNEITEQNVDYAMSLVYEDQEEAMVEMDRELICHTLQGKPIKPKTLGQKRYVDAIREGMITFGLGPAGTGKTYLAMAMAITAFQRNEVSRIILTRPAIEAGEKLGFLPGDLQSKIDPYLRPLYDALYQIMGAESFAKNSEKGLIEVAPLAYMRGRTLDNAFIILDEAQNTTPAQMKMFLTRIGFGSKVVITGDATQKDLPAGTVSGLDVAVKVVKNLEGISICTLTSKDVVRHPLLVEAALEYEGCPYEAEIDLLLTTDDEIHRMNEEFRQIDRATDVLSFPMLEYETPGDFSFVEEEAEAFNPESGELMLGDIVISKEKVLAQAEAYGHSPKREFAFLIAHSMLHLFGYDHMEEEERLVMEERQREIMETVQILRA